MARVGDIIVRDADIDRVKFELITFFKDNPGTVDSADKLCGRVGRSREEAERALEELSEHGICHKVPARPAPIYMYYASALILKRIAELAPDMGYDIQIELVNALLTR